MQSRRVLARALEKSIKLDCHDVKSPRVMILMHPDEEEMTAALKRAWSLGLLIGKKLRSKLLTACMKAS